MLAVQPPLEPMLARLERALPTGDGLAYEPKWDGFRCLAFVDDGEVTLLSRNGRPLGRYFPEVVEVVRSLGDSVVDGELVIRKHGAADFPALLGRLHPATSRVQRLAAESPATYVVFDLPAVAAEDLRRTPFAERRDRLERVGAAPDSGLELTPQTRDVDMARGWLSAPAGAGIDGVMVKPDDLLYEPGRRAMTKVKNLRTADCVVAGLRVHADGGVGSLLLGCYDAAALRHVGVAGSFTAARRAALRNELAPLVTSLPGHPWEHGFGLDGGALGRLKGTAGRWAPDMPRDWVPVAPERVAEVGYDHVEGWRFRHPARFLRWRPDRDAVSCTVEQLR